MHDHTSLSGHGSAEQAGQKKAWAPAICSPVIPVLFPALPTIRAIQPADILGLTQGSAQNGLARKGRCL